MTLKHLSDDVLIERLKKLVHEEREILMSVLHHLREVERRRLFAKYQCGSLFAYAVTELKYSELQADRRISAMWLLRDLPPQDTPQIEAKITSGRLSLTNLVLACKKELHFDLIDDDSLREKLLRLKGHYAHTQPNMNLTDLLHRLCDEKLESISKRKAPSAPRVNLKTTAAPVAAPSQAEVRRRVWRRDKGQCSNCRSTYALEIDHVRPRAVGGPSTLENTRLLCRSYNQRAAIEYFGLAKMAGHLARSPEIVLR